MSYKYMYFDSYFVTFQVKLKNYLSSSGRMSIVMFKTVELI